MASAVQLVITSLLFVMIFRAVDLAPLQNLQELLRVRRQFNNMGGNMNSFESDRIRSNMQHPGVNINRNTGAVSSSSISNAALVNQPKTLADGKPNLKLGQGLAIGISINGPLGTTGDTYDNTDMFNTDAGDSSSSFANAGRTGQRTNAANTGTSINLHNNNPGGFGTANTFNSAKFNAFNNGGGRRGGSQGGAGAFSNIS